MPESSRRRYSLKAKPKYYTGDMPWINPKDKKRKICN